MGGGKMIVVCCDCQRTIREKEPIENKAISHTVCPECLQKYPDLCYIIGARFRC